MTQPIMQVRQQLNAALRRTVVRCGWPSSLGQPVRDDEWDVLANEGHAQRVTAGAMTIDQVVDRLIELRRAFGRMRVDTRRAVASSDRSTAHERAIAELFVIDAKAKDIRFRTHEFVKHVLKGTPVRHLKAWAEREKRRQSRPTITNGRATVVRITIGDEIWACATRAESPLDRLRQLSERLAEYYGWDPADAATYILTGTTPPTPGIRLDVQRRWPLTARSRIVMTIDPTTAPETVMAMYRAIRRAEFGRRRRLDRTHSELAVFAAQYGPTLTIEHLGIWNGRRKVRKYRFLSVFQREALMALNALGDLQPRRARHRAAG